MKTKVVKLVRDTELIEGRGTHDTIKVWEGNREQALLWRALALLQIPTTLIAVFLTLTLWMTRSVTLNVPAKPQPGMYIAQDIPDSEFIDVATDFINLYATYQPSTARKQFSEARMMLIEPMLSKFDREIMETELRAIEGTSRSQVFYVDPTQTQIERLEKNREVLVSLVGDRVKYIAGQRIDPSPGRITLTLTSIPRNKLNPYGIVVKEVKSEQIVK